MYIRRNLCKSIKGTWVDQDNQPLLVDQDYVGTLMRCYYSSKLKQVIKTKNKVACVWLEVVGLQSDSNLDFSGWDHLKIPNPKLYESVETYKQDCDLAICKTRLVGFSKDGNLYSM